MRDCAARLLGLTAEQFDVARVLGFPAPLRVGCDTAFAILPRVTLVWREGDVVHWRARMAALGADVGGPRQARLQVPPGGSFIGVADVQRLTDWTDEQMEIARSLGFPRLQARDRGLYAEPPRFERVVLRHEVQRWFDSVCEVASFS